MKIGVPKDTALGPCTGDCGGLGLTSKPIVWYGSSITQGACASRPGDAYTNAIARALKRPVANYGFSGNCLYEPEVLKFLIQIDAAAYVLDCNPNSEVLGYDYVYKGAMRSVRTIRSERPATPIVLATGTKEGAVWLEGPNNQHANGTAALRKVYADLVAAGEVANVHFVNADRIYDQPDGSVPFWEMTVVGTHPTSLGMERFAAFYTPILSAVVNGSIHEVIVV